MTTLYSPVTIGGQVSKNRVALAPMTRARAGKERLANDLIKEYYLQRSSAGLLISEGLAISTQAIGWSNTPGIYTQEQVEAWKPVTAAVRATGALFYAQLWHSGRASHSSFREDGRLAFAPSAIKIEGEIHTPLGKQPTEVPQAITVEQIRQTVEEFAQAAKNAKEAGFDGIELHGANGYLIDEFLQRKSNQRTDEYGGSLENRFRFLKEILDEIKKYFPIERVAVRLSPNGVYNDMGSPDFRESFSYYIEQLNGYGLAYLHVMDGLGFGFHGLGEAFTLEDVRKLFKGIVIGNCGHDQKYAEDAVSQGRADLIAFGRPYISNPDLVERFKNNWPLAELAPYGVWYSEGAEGFTTFPPFSNTA